MRATGLEQVSKKQTRVLQKEWPSKYMEWTECQKHLTLCFGSPARV